MSLMTLAAICAAALGDGKAAPAGTDCVAVARRYQAAVVQIAPLLSAAQSRDAIARVAYAEAGNQGDSGLAGVVYTIVNRLADGGWGNGVGSVLNAPGQFEPVTRAGGWQHLPPRSAVECAHIDTIINLAVDGRLPDPTNGARFFQNPTIAAKRSGEGSGSAGLVNFGGQTPVAVIKDHAFFDSSGAQRTAASRVTLLFIPVQSAGVPAAPEAIAAEPAQPSSVFVPLNR